MHGRTRSIALVVAAAALCAPSSAAAITRYAVVGGVSSGTCDNLSLACNIEYAVENQAQTGDVISVAPGTYDLGGGNLAISDDNLTLAGAATSNPPVLTGTGGNVVSFGGGTSNVTVRDIKIVKPNNGYGLNAGGPAATIERVQVFHGVAHAATGVCANGTVIRDSLFVAPSLALSLIAPSSGDGTCELRNLTLVGSMNLIVSPPPMSGTQTIVAHGRNLIVTGGVSTAGVNGGTAVVQLAYSLLGSTFSVTDQGNNLIGSPTFANSAGDDYRLTPTSLGRNAGTTDGTTTATDLAGGLRPQGLGPEMGAYELPALPPIVTTDAATDVTMTAGTLHGTANPQSYPASAVFDYGPTTAYGSSTASTPVGSGNAAVPVQATLTGLSPGSVVHYRLRATGSEGTGNGSDATLTTTAAPAADPDPTPPASAPPPTTPPATTPPVIAPPVTNPGQVLLCSGHQVVLVDVHRQGAFEIVRGQALTSLAGKDVKITADHGGATTLAKVAKDGSFGIRVRRPKSNQTSYSASYGSDRAAPLKVSRNLNIVSQKRVAGGLRIRVRHSKGGRVAGETATIRRQTGCGLQTRYTTARFDKHGELTVVLPAPTPPDTIAVYRVTTRTNKTFTLPIVVRR